MARCNVLLFVVVAWAGMQFCNGLARVQDRPRAAYVATGTDVATNKAVAWNRPFEDAYVYNGEVLYGSDWVGRGACGTQLNHQEDAFASISAAWFTNRDPRRDQYCKKGVCVQAEYEGNTITVPVRHWFDGDRAILVLSQPPYEGLNPEADDVYFHGATWQFVQC